MPHLRFVVAICATLLSIAVLAPAAHAADGLTSGALYEAGPDGRYLMGGDWLFRLDSADQGLAQRFMRTTSTAGWAPTKVPNAWNATDTSNESMAGSIGWYRKDFHLPSSNKRMSWVLRFESVNYRARFWMNGKPIGANTGAYLPFEIRIPSSLLKRNGVNRLVVRVDNRRHPTDFPPSGLSTTNLPTGGWWNYGGILREVYLRKVDRIDFNTVVARPELPCASCDATVLLRTTVRNAASSAQRVRVTGSFGGRDVSLGSANVGAHDFATFSKRITVKNPRLWAPGSPTLYTARFAARVGSTKVAGWQLKTGIRKIQVIGGKLFLNGRPLNLRGVGLHEDDPTVGFAVDNARRAQYIAEVKELGRDDHPRPLPAASLPRGARRQGRHPPVVRGPGLRGQDAVPQARDRAQAGGEGAGGEHQRQPEPPVDHRLVAGQRAVARGRARSRATTSAGRPRRPRRSTRRARSASPSPATRRSAASPSTRRSTSSASTTTSAGTRARTA